MFQRAWKIQGVLAGILVAVLLVTGCGGASLTATPPPTATVAKTTAVPSPRTSPSPPPPSTPKYGGTLTLAQTADPPTYNFLATTQALATRHIMYTHSRLVRYKSKAWPENAQHGELTVAPDLAESWTISGGGTIYTFKLRQGVKWHEVAALKNKEFTSADVLVAWDRIAHHQSSVYKGDFTAMVKTEAPDKYTAVMTTSDSAASWLNRIADTEGSWMGSSEYIALKGTDYGVAQDSLVGTGPFIYEKAEAGARYTYVRNPTYFEAGLPYVDRIQMLIIKDASTREAAFIAGQLDAFSPSGATQTTRILKASTDIKLLETQGSTTTGGLVFNLLDKKWQDLRVRQAVKLVFPNQRMITDLYQGKALRAGCIPSCLLKYRLSQEELMALYPYDPVKAKQLMADAGFTPSAPLAIEMLVTTSGGDSPDKGAMLQAELDKIGFKVTIKPLPRDQVRILLIGGKFDTAMDTLANAPDPDDAVAQYTNGNSQNYSQLNDPKIETWYKQQRGEFNEAKRIAILQEFDRYCAAQALFLSDPDPYTLRVNWGWVRNYPTADAVSDDPLELHLWIDKS